MGRIPCYGRPESSSSNICEDKPFWCVKLCAWSHAKYLSLLALGFTHQKGLSYQIFELEDSGLLQQGILPISARKTITMANHRCLEKNSPHCAVLHSPLIAFRTPRQNPSRLQVFSSCTELREAINRMRAPSWMKNK